jgi:hypothetical protein
MLQNKKLHKDMLPQGVKEEKEGCVPVNNVALSYLSTTMIIFASCAMSIQAVLKKH